jgi:hypothetical protein
MSNEDGVVARWVRKFRGTARLRDTFDKTEIAFDTDDQMLKFGVGANTRQVVDNFNAQTIGGAKTFSGAMVAGSTLNVTGAAVLADTLDVTGLTTVAALTATGTVALPATTSKAGVVQQHADHAKAGTTAGWVVNAGDNKNSLGRQAAGTTAATLVVPLSLRVGDIIAGFYLVGQIEAGGNTCTVDAALRKQTAAAADLSDAAVTDGAITQVSVIADTILSASNAGVTGLSVTVAADQTYYILITSTTAAATDVDLQSVNVTKTAV